MGTFKRPIATAATTPIVGAGGAQPVANQNAVIPAATATALGGVLKAATVAAVASANAATQSGSYVQADVQSIATLANELKTQVNAILVAIKAAGEMA